MQSLEFYGKQFDPHHSSVLALCIRLFVCLLFVPLFLLSVMTSIGVFHSCIYGTRLSGGNLTVFFPLTRSLASTQCNLSDLEAN